MTTGAVTVDFAQVMAHVQQAMDDIAPVDSAESLEAGTVVVLMGRARFTCPATVEVNGEHLRFRQALIATGASPAPPSCAGSDAVELLTSETFWNLRELPDQLVILGGGAIGCEIAQAMARLGSAVTVVHRGPRVLPKEDEKVSAVILAAFRRDGVDVRTANPRSWAAGDVTGFAQFTHTAGVNASVASTNAILGLTRRCDITAIPWVTITHPEVGAVGLRHRLASGVAFAAIQVLRRVRTARLR